jgi:hypothetical protein
MGLHYVVLGVDCSLVSVTTTACLPLQCDYGIAGYPFILFTVETYGRLGKPALRLLARLGQAAAECAGGVSKSGLVAGAIRELSVGRCRGNFYVCRDGYGLLAGALGRCFRPCVARPMDEVV